MRARRWWLLAVMIGLLTNTAAWAVNVHVHAPATDQAPAQHQQGHDHDVQHAQHGGHGCHASAHLTGLTWAITDISHNPRGPALPPYRAKFPQVFLAPPKQPPRA